MPYKSLAQERYFNANRGKLEREGVDVDEWNEASKGEQLPMKTHTVHLDQAGKKPFKIKEGSLHAMLHIPQDEKIGETRLHEALHSRNPLIRRKASSGIGLSHMHHG